MNYPHFFSFFLLFFSSASVTSPTLSYSSLICSSVSFSLLLILFTIFFISVTVFSIAVWLFFMFYNSLLKTSNFALCIHSFLSSLIIFMITILNTFLGRLLTSNSRSSSSGFILFLCQEFYLVPLSPHFA